MKKSALFVCAIATSVASLAVVPNKEEVYQNPNITIHEVVTPRLNAPARAGAEAVTILNPYHTLENTYQLGKPTNGLSYDWYMQGLVSPYRKYVTFQNDSLLNADWYVSNTLQASGVPSYQMPVTFGKNELPLMKIEGRNDTTFLDYQLSRNIVAYCNSNYEPNYYSSLLVAPGYTMPITRCAMYTEDSRQNSNGEDFFSIKAGQYGDYSYGTKLTNPWQASTTMDTIIVRFGEEGGLMCIDHITLGVYTNGFDLNDMFPNATDHVRLTLYPYSKVDGSMVVDWENPIARTTANRDNFIPYSSDNSTKGLLRFNFMETDPDSGESTATYVTVEGTFVVALDEYNDGSANFGIFADYYNDRIHTFFPWYDYTEGKQYISRVWSHNIMLNLEAFFPTFEAPEEVYFDLEGGTKTLTIPSNLNESNIDIVADEWLTVNVAPDVVTVGEESVTQYTNTLTITANSTDVAREGSIYFEVYGLKVNIMVRQGESATAVENVNADADATNATKSLIDGQIYILHGDKTYTLQGQEVK